MKYKGYTAVLKADEEQGILFGRVLGLDVITFQAETVSQAIKEFHISVDTYLELCRSRQQSPEKPYSGNFMVRVNPELHRQIAILAQTKSVSINSLVASLIRDASKRRGGTGNVVRSVTLLALLGGFPGCSVRAERIQWAQDDVSDLGVLEVACLGHHDDVNGLSIQQLADGQHFLTRGKNQPRIRPPANDRAGKISECSSSTIIPHRAVCWQNRGPYSRRSASWMCAVGGAGAERIEALDICVDILVGE